MRLDELTYTDEELEKDAIHYLKSQVYEPLYAGKVKQFIAEDLLDFKRFYDDGEYLLLNVFYDEYRNITASDDKPVNTDFPKLTAYMEQHLERFDVSEDDVENYVTMLDAEFRKNAFCSHMEAYFAGQEAVVSTVLVGYSRNPLFSIYSLAREWCMALHLKKMYPSMVKKFGFMYQNINFNCRGEEKLRKLLEFRDKYQHIFKNVGILRAIHSSVFAYAYIFLKGVQTKEILTAEDFIMNSSSSKVTLLLQGESIRNFDYPVTKYVIERFKEGHYREFFTTENTIDWEALYDFTFEAIKNSGFENVHLFGFDSIEAKTMQGFWNKSANMQSMLKILRKLALESNNPLFNRLIEGCEYRMGRKDKAKEKMEHFIEVTRKIMAARAYEITRPRTMAQELISAFPSVFLVYFQWHHNFRNIYPKVPKKKVYEEELRLTKIKNDYYLKDALKNEQYTNITKNNAQEKKYKDNEDNEKLRSIMKNRDRTRAELSGIRRREQRINESRKMAAERVNKQNTY